MLIKRIYLQKDAPKFRDAIWAKPEGDKITMYMSYNGKWVLAGEEKVRQMTVTSETDYEDIKAALDSGDEFAFTTEDHGNATFGAEITYTRTDTINGANPTTSQTQVNAVTLLCDDGFILQYADDQNDPLIVRPPYTRFIYVEGDDTKTIVDTLTFEEIDITTAHNYTNVLFVDDADYGNVYHLVWANKELISKTPYPAGEFDESTQFSIWATLGEDGLNTITLDITVEPAEEPEEPKEPK